MVGARARTAVAGECTPVTVGWSDQPPPADAADPVPRTEVSLDAPEIVAEDGDRGPALVETSNDERVLFTGREPRVLATFPDGYLASTGILGTQTSAAHIGPELDGLRFVSDAVTPFGLSAMYREAYPVNPDAVVTPDDGEDGYEGWLYFGDYDDAQHRVDAPALVAAGLAALERTGEFDANPIEPFASEGESFRALHAELAFCAELTFADQTHPHRDPSTFTPDQLAESLADPAAFVADNKIGYPSHNVAPQRKLSWWFNSALGQFAVLADAGIDMPASTPGAVQP